MLGKLYTKLLVLMIGKRPVAANVTTTGIDLTGKGAIGTNIRTVPALEAARPT